MKRTACLIITAIFMIHFIACSACAESLRAVGDSDYPPLVFVDRSQRQTGYDLAVLQEISKRMGRPVQIQLMDWNRAKASLDSGSADILIGLNRTRDREKSYTFSEPYLNNKMVIFVRKINFFIQGPDDLINRRVGVQKADLAAEYLKTYYPLVNLYEFKNQREALIALRDGRVDAVVGNYYTGVYIIEQNKLVNDIKTNGQAVLSTPYCFGMRFGNLVLKQQIDQAIVSMEKDGTLTALQNEWFGENYIKSLETRYGIYLAWLPFAMIAVLIVLVGSWAFIYYQRRRVQGARRHIDYLNRLYQALIENAHDSVLILAPSGKILYASPNIEQLLGLPGVMMVGQDIMTFVHPDERLTVQKKYDPVFSDPGETVRMDIRLRHTDGGYRHIETVGRNMVDDPAVRGVVVNASDISQRKGVEQALSRSESDFRELVQAVNSIIMRIDNEGHITFLNEYALKFFGYDAIELIGRSMMGTLMEETRELQNMLEDIGIHPERYVTWENQSITKSGSRVWVSWTNRAILDADGQVLEILCVGNDMTERKQAEEQMRFLSLHDPLTGLYNRAYFEEEMVRLEGGRHDPVGIIICDVDSLKLVNDILGHRSGDALLKAAADALRASFRDGDMMARIGGDEFAVLLPDASTEAVQGAVERVRRTVTRYNHTAAGIPLSISVGYAVSGGRIIGMQDLYREADNNMYKVKPRNSQNARKAIISAFMQEAVQRGAGEQSGRDIKLRLIEELGRAFHLGDDADKNLLLLAQFHDVGNVGVDEQIFRKAGQLNEYERAEVQRHCEIGYRIALAAPGLYTVSELILRHHEWWDGGGYPLGLQKNEIPIECRIVSLVAAFCSMIAPAVYRSPMTLEEAAEEVRRGSGTQFDPELVKVFLRIVENDRHLLFSPAGL